jgi:hypothetical protein
VTANNQIIILLLILICTFPSHPDILKDQSRATAENDENLNMRIGKILEQWMKLKNTPAKVDEVVQKVVLSTHRRAYEEIMEFIKYFQFRGICVNLNIE